MQILSIISLLIDYPEAEILVNKVNILSVIRESQYISEIHKKALTDFVIQRCDMGLLDWQSEYDAMFERGRSLSLFLFEHLHGESRDRGQAMVDLQQQYQQAGLDIGVKELPDYIPLYLEFLSTQGDQNAAIGLSDVAHILAVLAARLDERNSNYASLFHALLYMASVTVDIDGLRDQVKQEERDDTAEALDKVWEEEMVKFTADDNSCGTSVLKPTEAQRRDHEQFITLADMVNLQSAAQV